MYKKVEYLRLHFTYIIYTADLYHYKQEYKNKQIKLYMQARISLGLRIIRKSLTVSRVCQSGTKRIENKNMAPILKTIQMEDCTQFQTNPFDLF